jgi:hypothetical protein
MAGRGHNATGGDIVAEGLAPSDTPTENQYRSGGKDGPETKYKYESGTDIPAVLRRPDGYVPQDEAERMLDACQTLARRARDAFKEACEAASPDEAEASFLTAKHKLRELWNYAHLRDRAFRDLLSLLSTAINSAELPEIGLTERDVLRQAFADLPRLFLDDALVEQHIDRFADQGIDRILDPIRPAKGKKIKVIIEEIE